MRYAVTNINGQEQYVTKEIALKSGTCYLCGHSLKKHPVGKGQQIPINRHHCLEYAHAPLFAMVPGKRYPPDETNVYWVGAGCHIQYHKECSLKPETSIETVTQFIEAILNHLQQIDFGRNIFPAPCELPPHLLLSRAARRAAFYFLL